MLSECKENAGERERERERERDRAHAYFNSTTKTKIGLGDSLDRSFQEIFNRIDNWINEGSV